MIVVRRERCQLELLALPICFWSLYERIRTIELNATLKGLAKFILAALVALALWDQIVRDPAYRTWQGQIFGIPYDFRRPTLAKLRNAFWSPTSERLLSPHVFGVGWTVNAGRAYQLLRKRFGYVGD